MPAETPLVYEIVDWDTHYETADSRKRKELFWVRIPVGRLSKRYRRLMRRPDGPEVFAVWIAVLQLAATMPTRGLLVDAKGEALTADDIEDETDMPATVVANALGVLAGERIGWLTASGCKNQTECKPKPKPKPNTTTKKDKAPLSGSWWPEVVKHLPTEMNTDAMQSAWGEWEAERKTRGKRITKAAAIRQAKNLAEIGQGAAIEAIDASITNGWTGLVFKDRTNGNQRNAQKPGRQSGGLPGNAADPDEARRIRSAKKTAL